MEMQEIVQLIGSFISAAGLPLIGAFMFYESRKRKAAAEAKKAEANNITQYAEEWKELYEKKEKRVGELDTKIDTLYAKIEELRQHIRELTEKNTELIIRNSALDFRKCNKHGCPDREPPSEF